MAQKKEMKMEPTIEELKQVNAELLKKFNAAITQLQKAEAFIASIQKIDYLLKALELPAAKFSSDFIVYATTEIENALMPKETENEIENPVETSEKEK